MDWTHIFLISEQLTAWEICTLCSNLNYLNLQKHLKCLMIKNLFIRAFISSLRFNSLTITSSYVVDIAVLIILRIRHLRFFLACLLRQLSIQMKRTKLEKKYIALTCLFFFAFHL